MALYVHDIARARAYYKDFLGYGEPFKLDSPDGTLSLTFIKINEELLAAPQWFYRRSPPGHSTGGRSPARRASRG
jgi:catechol 2,3-dioxygenase-like lactoylglutathione lyase family enzyme